MNYPPYDLSKRTRSVIFAIFSTVFVFLAPTVALYAAGYRLNMDSFGISRIGVLSVDILPSNASIYLNNKLVAQNLPLRLSNLIPGTYNLRLEKEGYLPWIKDITIEENKTTYIKNFALFLVSDPEAMETNEYLTDIFPSHDAKYLVEKFETPAYTQLTLFTTGQEHARELLKATSTLHIEPLWSERSHGLALLKRFPSSREILVLNPEEPNKKNTFSFEEAIDSLQWRENFYRNKLLVRFQNQLYTLDEESTSKAETLRTTSTVFYRGSDDTDWYFDAVTKTLRNSKNSSEDIYLGTPIQKIIDINDSRIITQTQESLLVINRSSSKKITTVPTPNFFYDSSRKEYITWSPWELWTLYENGEIALLNRMSEEIQQVLALDETGELLIITKNKMLGFNPGYYVTREIRSDVQIQKATVDKRNRTIYFLGTWQDKKGLYKLKY